LGIVRLTLFTLNPSPKNLLFVHAMYFSTSRGQLPGDRLGEKKAWYFALTSNHKPNLLEVKILSFQFKFSYLPSGICVLHVSLS
jgi:hypothetical protein